MYGLPENGADAEDIFQTVFLKYALHGRAFESAEHEKAWLIRVAVNACKDLLSRVLCRAYNIAEEENVIYYRVDWETVRAAQAAQLCIPRYLAWQQLLLEDPSVTAEDVKQLPKEEIHQMVQMDIVENPCGE